MPTLSAGLIVLSASVHVLLLTLAFQVWPLTVTCAVPRISLAVPLIRGVVSEVVRLVTLTVGATVSTVTLSDEEFTEVDPPAVCRA
jgi:hypothetical protein